MRLAGFRRFALLVALAAGAVGLVRCGSSSSSPPPLCNCAAGDSCVAGTCVPLACTTPTPAASAAQAPVQVFALGTKKVGTTVPFAVPAGAASITIMEQIVTAPATATFTNLGAVPNSATPLDVTAPGGVIYDLFKPPADPTQAKLYFASLSPGAGTLTLPDTTAGLGLVASGLPQGTWSFVVSDLAYACTLASNCAPGGGNATSTYDVTVIVKPGTGAGNNIPAAGQVDVTFNLTPAGLTPPLSAATAGTDPDLQRMVTTLGTFLARANLTLGTVNYVDVPSAMATRIASGVNVDDGTVCGELSQILATAPPGRQVNLFMVSTFISSQVATGTFIAGVDGTIPGPATASPNLQSGAAVGALDLRSGRSNCVGASPVLNCGPSGNACCGADRTAYVAAHEMGHFFGLYHVTEQEGTFFDPLQDTAMCPCLSCATDPTQCADATPPPASPHTMGVSECEKSTTCGGGDDLMFWLLANASVGNLTAEQQLVIRANPAVY